MERKKKRESWSSALKPWITAQEKTCPLRHQRLLQTEWVTELLSWEVLSHQTQQFNPQEMGNTLAWHSLAWSKSSREGWTSKGSGDQFSLWKDFKTLKLLWSISDLELGTVFPTHDLLDELNSLHTSQITHEFTLTSHKNDSMIMTWKCILASKLFTVTSASHIHHS